jgi:hypothetical protein
MAAMAGNSSGQYTSSSGGFSAAQVYQGIGGVFGALGSYQSGRIALQVGRMRNRLAKENAKQLVAASQREALAQRKNAELLASRALAVAAAGGGGADDNTVLKIISDIDAEGAYRAAVAMYEGEERASKMRFEGSMAEWEGEQAYDVGKIAAIGGLFETGAKIAKYG